MFGNIMMSSSRVLSSLLFLVLLLILCEVGSVKIRELRVPETVENGTNVPILLDCDFTRNREERTVVINWFFNDNPAPIYQWIPEEHKRLMSDFTKGHLDEDYEAGKGFYTKYRALLLRNVTTKFSGRYGCQVLTSQGHDQTSRKMVVYAPVKRMSIDSTDKESNIINMTCEAEGMVPKPRIAWFHRTDDGSRTLLKAGVYVEKRSENKGYFAKLAISINRTASVKDGKYVNYDCVISIPEASYKKTQSIRIKNYDSSVISGDSSGNIWRKTAASTKDVSSTSSRWSYYCVAVNVLALIFIVLTT